MDKESGKKSHATCLFGAIAGDMIGQRFEHHAALEPDFMLFTEQSHFTDDTVLTVAVAEALLKGGDYLSQILRFARRHPYAGYGGGFRRWIRQEENPAYNSFGNGSAMRVSPVGWAFDTVDQVLKEAKRSADVTHNHPEGVKGAQAVALCVLLARQGAGKEEMRGEVQARFGYNMGRTLAEVARTYRWDVT